MYLFSKYKCNHTHCNILYNILYTYTHRWQNTSVVKISYLRTFIIIISLVKVLWEGNDKKYVPLKFSPRWLSQALSSCEISYDSCSLGSSPHSLWAPLILLPICLSALCGCPWIVSLFKLVIDLEKLQRIDLILDWPWSNVRQCCLAATDKSVFITSQELRSNPWAKF